ncbi:MAG: hypothetical protein ABJF11_13520 [Reichenbachiella sp.]|uniref:hypothetical protein n=1 Tax=Reichenbachiella sp. TaxID=2184521 RepID=UPI0032679573
MKSIKRTFFILFILLATSCEENKTEEPTYYIPYEPPLLCEPTDDEIVNLLCNWWKHSEEEEEDTFEKPIYRPADFKEFPAIRGFRAEYVLSSDFTCAYLVPDPFDAHYFSEGKWSLRDSELIIIIDSLNATVSKMKIIELTDDMLRIERIK